MKVIIIGASTAGTICAWELRKQNKDCDILLIEQSNNTQYSPCAMPYVLSGETTKENITLLTKEDYKNNNITLLNNTTVEKILPHNNKIMLSDEELSYDFLVLATGSHPVNPGIKLRTNKFTFFKTIQDMDIILDKIKTKNKITIIGAGFIGVETAHALAIKQKEVTLIEAKNQILPELLDKDLADDLEDELKKYNISILKEELVKEISDIIKTNIQEFKTDFTIISTGIKSRIELARDAKIDTDKGIVTNRFQQTNFKNIYACGDCTEITNKITGESIVSGLANSASMQAKTVARNILGSKEKISSALSSNITKIGKLYVASTGLTTLKAKNFYKKIISSKITMSTTAAYYSQSSTITTKLIADIKGKIIGAQILSHENPAGYINLINLAITNNISLKQLSGLETPYNPASNPLSDPVITTAKILLKKLNLINKQKNT